MIVFITHNFDTFHLLWIQITFFGEQYMLWSFLISFFFFIIIISLFFLFPLFRTLLLPLTVNKTNLGLSSNSLL